MNKHLTRNEPFARRAKLSSREILLATALTLAAVVFVMAALRDAPSETAAIEAPGPLHAR